MENTVFKFAKWICPLEFKNEKPIDLFSKEKGRTIPELPEKFKNIHMLVKKDLFLKEKKQNYKIRITADDYYKLYINDNR